MKIEILPEIYILLMDVSHLTNGKEFSGLGFCRREKNILTIYDFVLLDQGSEVFTEIPPAVILPLLERSDAGNMKVWLHKHPLGNGKPGKQNWSGTDEKTIQTAPLGGFPEAVKWSASIVLTPKGWVGRVDNYITHKTIHCEVFPQSQAAEMLQTVRERKRKSTLRRAAIWTAELFSDDELAGNSISREEWIENISIGLEDGSLLPENVSPDDLADLLDYYNQSFLELEEEELEPYPPYGYFRRQPAYHQLDWGGRHWSGHGAGPGENGRHGDRGVRR